MFLFYNRFCIYYYFMFYSEYNTIAHSSYKGIDLNYYYYYSMIEFF